MKSNLILVGVLLGISAMTDVTFAAGRSGFGASAGGGGGGSSGGGNAGGGTGVNPGAGGGGGAGNNFRGGTGTGPSMGSSSFRAPDPVRPPAPPTYVPPPAVQTHRPPPNYGSAGVLPSTGGPVDPPGGNQFQSSRAAPAQRPYQPASPRPLQPVNPPTAPSASLPAQAAARAAQRADFLGLRNDPAHRPGGPNRAPAQSPFPTFDGNAIVAPGTTLHASTRRPVLPEPPGKPARPAHPPVSDRWKPADEKFANQFNRWSQNNAGNLAVFQAGRGTKWNAVQQKQTAAAWRGQYKTAQYQQWRRGLWDFRKGRAIETWSQTSDLHHNLFDNHWWDTCWWRHRAPIIVINTAPWWWWNPCTWTNEVTFFGPDLGPDPIPYDPGSNVYYDDDSYTVDGRDSGSAADARNRAFELASPQVDDIPVPGPAPDGDPQRWLPLGVWALTPQEQGDPILFFQLSVNKDGLVAGGYKSALTGEEQPIVGQLDKRQQRLAWHVANTPTTVFETGLSSLDYDVASVFVHFNAPAPETQTQTWLLVRLPSPEMPPGPVKVPDGAE